MSCDVRISNKICCFELKCAPAQNTKFFQPNFQLNILMHAFDQEMSPVLPSSPVCPVGLTRAHSSLTVNETSWWPPPLPACGAQTASAGALVGGAAGGQAGRCVRTAGCQGGRARAHRCGSLEHNCSHCWGPQRHPPHYLEHHLPHWNTRRIRWVSSGESVSCGHAVLYVWARSMWQIVNFDTPGRV